MLLREMKDIDRLTVEKLTVTKAQCAFVDPIAETLINTATLREHYVMEEKGEIVGFFQVDSTSGNQCVGNHLDLHEVLIDISHQGKGYGREFAVLLPDFLKQKYPTWGGVCLTVNCKNTLAKRLYECAGFVETGGLKTEGRSGTQYIMRRPI